jgi:hypothetical protein
VATLYYFQIQKNFTFIFLGIFLSWFLALLSFHFVESPIRKLQFDKLGLRSLMTYCLASLAIFSLAFLVVLNKGIPSRLDPLVVMADADRSNRNQRHECNMTPTEKVTWPRCVYGENTEKVALIVAGDSHSNSVITAIADSIPNNIGGALFIGADACPFSRDFKTTYFPGCAEFNDGNIKWLKENYFGTPLLIVNRTTSNLYGDNEAQNNRIISYIGDIDSNDPEYLDNLIKEYTSLICEMAEYHPIYILEPIPEIGVNVPNQLSRNIRFHDKRDEITILFADYQTRHQKTKELHTKLAEKCGVKLLDPSKYLCDGKHCYGSMDGRALYFDDDHLNEWGNRKLIPLFRSIWNQ